MPDVFKIMLECSQEGCDATALLEPFDLSWGGENLSGGRSHLWIETGWTNTPEGWTLGDPSGDDAVMVCPAHGGKA